MTPLEVASLCQAIPPWVVHVVRVLTGAGHAAVVVGGAVRDLVLGEVPQDFDVASSATPAQVMALFSKTVPTGVEHGTVTVLVHGPQGPPRAVEVTTFRTEGGYVDGRHPTQVEFVTRLEDDLSRRDFTINAMALALEPQPNLVDPFGGVLHLKEKRLVTVGDPLTRFNEDGLRAVRAARFASQLQLTPATGLEDAMAAALPVVAKVAAERFLQELTKLLERSTKPSLGLRMLVTTGLLAWMAPSAPGDAASLERVDRVGPVNLTARWAAWLWDAGPAAARDALTRLKASTALRDDVVALCGLPRPASQSAATPAQLRAMVRKLSHRRLDGLHALWLSEGGAPQNAQLDAVLQQGFVEKASQLALDGNALAVQSGLKGQALGALLAQLLRCVDEDPACNTAAGLCAWVERLGTRAP